MTSRSLSQSAQSGPLTGTESRSRVKYVLLARHGKVLRDLYVPDRFQVLDPVGRKESREVAKALVDQLSIIPESVPIDLRCLWHGTYGHTTETASHYQGIFHANGKAFDLVQSRVSLDPDRFWRLRTQQRGRSMRSRLTRADRKDPHKRLAKSLHTGWLHLGGGNAVLIIGHQPQLSWISEELGCANMPIARSEVACLELYSRFGYIPKARLLWTIVPTDEAAARSIRDKIKSKMEVAKVFGSVLAAVLGLILGTLLDADRIDKLKDSLGTWSMIAAYGAGASFLIGTVFYLATVVAYDRLLMPARFWGESARESSPGWLVRRPPSSEAYVLYQNMMRIWNGLFLPATALLVGGLLLMCSIFAPLEHWRVSLGGLAGIVVVVIYVYRRGRPRLGAQD